MLLHLQRMIDELSNLMEYLDQRGAPYGIDGSEILDQIPQSVRKPEMAYQYMQLKDISHIEPLSQGGEPAGDNWFLEDKSVNRSRGAETVTEAEQVAAKEDGYWDAQKIQRIAVAAGIYTVSSGAIETAIGAAAGMATAAAEGAAIAVIGSAVATAAAVTGCAVGTVVLAKHAHDNQWLSKLKRQFT